MVDKSFDEGAAFVLSDFPQGSLFGIDCQSWHVGDKFRGVKNIPPGWHLITCAAASKDSTSSSMVSFFLKCRAKEIIAKKWDMSMEDFDAKPVTHEDLNRLRENKSEVDRYLGLYPIEQYRKWLSLSNFIGDDVINMLVPSCGYVYSATQFLSEKASQFRCQEPVNNSPPESLYQAEARMPKLQPDESTSIRYSEFNRRSFEQGSNPSDISMHSIDSSYHLEALFSDRFNSNYSNLLGELQFSFVSFLIAQNYDSFEQWKKMVELICNCDCALKKYNQFFLDFIKVLYYHLKEVPPDFFVDIVSSNNFLTITLQRFFSNVDLSPDASSNLKERTKHFQKYVTQHYKWDFTAELAEDQPVIVDLNQ